MKKILSRLFLCTAIIFSICGNILASEPIITLKKESFSIKEISQNISEAISAKVRGAVFGVKYGYITREGSDKSYSFEEAEKSGIEDLFEINNIVTDKENRTFEAILIPDNATYRLIAKGKFTESKKVPIANMMIKKNHIITEDEINYKYIPSGKVMVSAIKNENLIIGKIAKRNIAKNSQILSGDVENPVIIKKGKAVVAIYRSKNMEIKLTAQALADGRVGEIIKLKNLDSGKEFLGMAEKPNTVLVNFSDELVASR